MENFLEPGELIAARLKDRLPPNTHVGDAAEIQEIEKVQTLKDGVFVVFDGFRPTQQGDAVAVEIETEQVWFAVVAVRNVAGIVAGSGARKKAGELIVQTMRALQGWLPSKSFTRLRHVPAPRAAYRAGFMFVPIAFATKARVKGDATSSAH